ncbi:MAG: family 10 glycosylhydrolase, partial [Clostridia bacterium]|nr:family 10 glycosylhydrolase [Clostridia bacterium]
TLTLDALEYLIEAAHGEGIAVHAWVNPLRIATGGSVEDLNEKSPARLHPEWCVKYADSKLYYDCGIPQVRETVAAGVREIVKNYDVDGIAFDDYFYPYPVYGEDGAVISFEDDKTFAKYGGDFESVGDWRRDNVNKMVKLVYDTVKEINGDCIFGIAPFGIWKNGYGGEDGSATAGSQSYYDIFCDTLAWVRGGYVDYIAPQLYWRNEEKAAPYQTLCEWWANMTEDSGVGLIICHGAYRYSEWDLPEGTMKAQAEYAMEYDNYCGSVFYGYEEIYGNVHGIKDEIKSLYENPLTEK